MLHGIGTRGKPEELISPPPVRFPAADYIQDMSLIPLQRMPTLVSEQTVFSLMEHIVSVFIVIWRFLF